MVRKHKDIQVITKKGQPEWAVIPYKDYLRLRELEGISKDVKAFKRALASGEEELIPDEYAHRLIKGENPIRVWREYRGLSQTALAKSIDISIPYLSQLESGDRKASTDVLKKIAKKLELSLDDLV